MIENCVQTSVFNLLTNSMSVNGQVYDIANRHTGFRKHFICEETLRWGDSPTPDQDTSRIKYTRGANFTKLCRRHRETSTTFEQSSDLNGIFAARCLLTGNSVISVIILYVGYTWYLIHTHVYIWIIRGKDRKNFY